FHKLRGNLERDTRLTLDDWDNLLLICGECREGAKDYNPQQRDHYLWPDSEMASSYPFRYVKRDNVTYKVLDAEGNLFKEEQRTFVFAETANDVATNILEAAKNTIALFKLNTKYYDNNQIIIPYQDFIDVSDLRLEQRYEAYQAATKAAGRLQRAAETLVVPGGREFVDNALILTNEIRESMGYVSTWKTAILANLDRETLGKIFPNITSNLKRRREIEAEVEDELLLEDDERPTKRQRKEIWPGPPTVPPV
ncbi:MAG: hypothetical protein F6K65_31465, partial [Moorea sp. SIO3C2]|nr:hypothetical protein [Moorena sp. SIO3C2]